MVTAQFRPENRMTFVSPDGWWGFDVLKSGTIHVCRRGLMDEDDDWMVVGAINLATLVEGLKIASVIDESTFRMVEDVKRGQACRHCGHVLPRHYANCRSFEVTEHTGDGSECNAHDHGHCSVMGCANESEPDPVVGRAICDRCLTPNGVLAQLERSGEAGC